MSTTGVPSNTSIGPIFIRVSSISRDVLKGHPRSDPNRPLTGVFYTRSPARPNLLGLHPVTVREINPPSREGCGATRATRLRIGPIEAFDGTPVVDIKSASTRADG